jgi:hypothetical protein
MLQQQAVQIPAGKNKAKSEIEGNSHTAGSHGKR